MNTCSSSEDSFVYISIKPVQGKISLSPYAVGLASI